MRFFKNLNGLQILKADRLYLNNGSATEPAISVNGNKLGVSHLDTGNLVFGADGKVFFKDANGNNYHILHENSTINVKFQGNDGVAQNKIQEGQIIPAGDNAKKQASPAPFVYIDTTGRLGSDNIWNALFLPNVMGYTDVDKPNTYSHGLVPPGSSTHSGLFLRKDGQWGQPSIYTGSVSETMLSLQDTPATYQGQLDKFLRVSYANGGSVVFHSISTTDVPEGTNLYHTEARVESKITQKMADRSLASLSVQGTVTANEFVCDSDRRLKQRIAPLSPSEALGAVLQLEPKSYRFKGNPKKRYGLVSQEVKEVIPDVVKVGCLTEGVNYLELIPFLIGSIQKLETEVRELRLLCGVSCKT